MTEYDKALEVFRVASKKYERARLEYRQGYGGYAYDTARFLEAREKFGKAQEAMDKAEKIAQEEQGQ